MAGCRPWRDLLAETMTPAQRARAQTRREALAAADRVESEAIDADPGTAATVQDEADRAECARLDAAADRLNVEAADALGYQAVDAGELEHDG